MDHPARGATEASPPTVLTASLGAWCVRNGYATAEQVQECLRVQGEAARAGKTVPRLGELLVARRLVTPELIARALSEQNQEIRYCPRCDVRVNVPRRADAAWYRCVRCEGPLQPNPPQAPVDVVDEGPIVVSRDPVPSEVEHALKDPAARFGKYVLLRELGSGAVGRVYLAWDTFLSQHVAVKRIQRATSEEPAEAHESRVASLLKEARNAIRLRHPGIVALRDVGRIGSDYFISMEYLEGQTLHDLIAAARRMGLPSPYYQRPREMLRILVESARAVHHAHSQPSPIVHCDLKPGNILVDPNGHPHVLDFGLARVLRRDRPPDEDWSGTPSYMAPEQCSGEFARIGTRTDVYALGAILYEMLTGRPPFVGEPLTVIRRAVEELPEPPSDVLKRDQDAACTDQMSTRRLLQIPPFLEALCLRCLSKDPDQRPATLAEVADAIELGDRAPSSPPRAAVPAPPPAPPRRARRGPLVLAIGLGAAALAVALVAGLRSGRSDAEVHARIGEFRPDLALAAAGAVRDPERAALLAEEARWVARVQERLAAHLTRTRPDVGDFRLRGRAIPSCRVTSADGQRVVLSSPSGPVTVAWEEVEPSQVLSLARTLSVSDEDSLGLGLFSLRAGLPGPARDHLGRAAKGRLSIVAERYLKRVAP